MCTLRSVRGIVKDSGVAGLMSEFFASQLLLDQLEAEGMRLLFGTPRSQQSPFFTVLASPHKRFQFVESLHENIACGIALGYAQASGTCGVVSVPTAPGFIAALPSIFNARAARVPLIILSDQPDAETMNAEPLLSADVLSLAAPLCKWSCQVNSVAEIPLVIRRAFHEALYPPRGPVFVSLPINLTGSVAVSKTMAIPLLSPLGAANVQFVKKAAQRLINAKLPCIIAGNEVAQYRARADQGNECVTVRRFERNLQRPPGENQRSRSCCAS